MLFEQVFYTWGRNQLSRYETGLGVCASSNMDSVFLDQALSLGDRFEAELSDATAQFAMYSPEFRTFISGGVSPRNVEGETRANKLCHFFIPVDKEITEENCFLLEYPFENTWDGERSLPKRDINLDFENFSKESYYQSLLEKYNLKGERLARLLWKVYPCLFQEVGRTAIIIDREQYEEKEDAKIAREITWLLSMLVPATGDLFKMYRERLSYCVYAERNIKLVSLVFTPNEELCDQKFYLKDAETQENVPNVYKTIASYAEQSIQAFREFMEEFVACQSGMGFKHNRMQLMYCKWKLDQKEKEQNISIESEDFEDQRVMLMGLAKNTQWYRELLFSYVQHVNNLKNDEMINLWTGYFDETQAEYETWEAEDKNKFEECIRKIITSMFQCNRKNYGLFLEDLQLQLKEKIFFALYDREEDVCWQSEFDEIEDEAQLCEYAEKYELLLCKDDFRKQFMEKAQEIYCASGWKERNQITETMLACEEVKEEWEKWIHDRIPQITESCENFMGHLVQEKEKIEPNHLILYYRRLCDATELQKNSSDEEIIGEFVQCEKALREIYSNMREKSILDSAAVPEIKKYCADFDGRKKAWEERLTLKRISESKLEDLVNLPMQELCLKGYGIRCIAKAIDGKADINTELYRKMVRILVETAEMKGMDDDFELYRDKMSNLAKLRWKDQKEVEWWLLLEQAQLQLSYNAKSICTGSFFEKIGINWNEDIENNKKLFQYIQFFWEEQEDKYSEGQWLNKIADGDEKKIYTLWKEISANQEIDYTKLEKIAEKPGWNFLKRFVDEKMRGSQIMDQEMEKIALNQLKFFVISHRNNFSERISNFKKLLGKQENLAEFVIGIGDKKLQDETFKNKLKELHVASMLYLCEKEEVKISEKTHVSAEIYCTVKENRWRNIAGVEKFKKEFEKYMEKLLKDIRTTEVLLAKMKEQYKELSQLAGMKNENSRKAETEIIISNDKMPEKEEVTKEKVEKLKEDTKGKGSEKTIKFADDLSNFFT